MTLHGAETAAWDLCPLEVAILLRSGLAVVWERHLDKCRVRGIKYSVRKLHFAEKRAVRLVDSSVVQLLRQHGLTVVPAETREAMRPWDPEHIPGRLIPRIMVPEEEEE